MKPYRTLVIPKLVPLILSILLLHSQLALFSQDQRSDRLEGLFQWAVSDYQGGKYREVVRDLELLLSYFDEESATGENSKEEILKGKIYLLLGATYERLGQIKKARENYHLSKEILEKHQVEMTIDGLDFTPLEEYRRFAREIKAPGKKKAAKTAASVVRGKKGIIVKSAKRPKKKGISPLLIVGGIVLAGGVIAALLLKKKSQEEDATVPNYDTQVLGLEWEHIPSYLFWMGDNFGEGETDELPVHMVALDDYYMSKYEVTFDQYDTFCRETARTPPSDNGWGRGNHPVIYVDWSDAKAFCNWLSQKTGKHIELPTEAQWEKAARGTEQPRYPWGDSPPDCTKTNYGCDTKTHPIGAHPEGISPYGIYDMAGNVSEWCLDNYNAQYYSVSPSRNPECKSNTYPDSATYVIRGGSWNSSSGVSARAADRGSMAPFVSPKCSYLGFRVVWNYMRDGTTR